MLDGNAHDFLSRRSRVVSSPRRINAGAADEHDLCRVAAECGHRAGRRRQLDEARRADIGGKAIRGEEEPLGAVHAARSAIKRQDNAVHEGRGRHDDHRRNRKCGEDFDQGKALLSAFRVSARHGVTRPFRAARFHC